MGYFLICVAFVRHEFVEALRVGYFFSSIDLSRNWNLLPTSQSSFNELLSDLVLVNGFRALCFSLGLSGLSGFRAFGLSGFRAFGISGLSGLSELSGFRAFGAWGAFGFSWFSGLSGFRAFA